MLSDWAHRRGGPSPPERAYTAYEPICVRGGAGAGSRESVGLVVGGRSEIVTVRTRNDSSGVAAYQGPPEGGVAGLCHVRQRGGA